jgi:hypothetical protein
MKWGPMSKLLNPRVLNITLSHRCTVMGAKLLLTTWDLMLLRHQVSL